MDIATREAVVEAFLRECGEIRNSKGQDYAGRTDCLANFKRNAERLGLTKYQVWLVYAMKHIDAITSAIRKNPAEPWSGTESEPLQERFKDAVNYVLLAHAMCIEDTTEDTIFKNAVKQFREGVDRLTCDEVKSVPSHNCFSILPSLARVPEPETEKLSSEERRADTTALWGDPFTAQPCENAMPVNELPEGTF